MPLIPLSCPNCGGNLTVESSKDAAICEFCGKPYIVKDAIVQNYINNVINIDTVNVFAGKDYVVKSGVLVEYNGEGSDIKIPDSVKELSADVFAGLPIETLEFSEGIKIIPAYAFQNCKALRKVVFPNSLETIGESAFGGCVSLVKLEIPDNVKLIDTNAFRGCINLESVYIDKAGADIRIEHTAFYECDRITKVFWAGRYSSECTAVFSNRSNRVIQNEWKGDESLCPWCGHELKQKRNGKLKCTFCERVY